jgi:hypothetical protein
MIRQNSGHAAFCAVLPGGPGNRWQDAVLFSLDALDLSGTNLTLTLTLPMEPGSENNSS